MDLRFTKMHGCGNDFVVVDDRDEVWEFDADAVSLICDRHFGIGADGMILVRPATDPAARLPHALHQRRRHARRDVRQRRARLREVPARPGAARGRLRTRPDAGRHQADRDSSATPTGRSSPHAWTWANRSLSGPDIPTTLPGDPVIDAPLDTTLGPVSVTCVSMGNPHAIVWVDDVDSAPVTTLGPVVETHAAFPARTNVEFAQVLGADADGIERIRLRVWERGVGETLACGTGACATLVAAALTRPHRTQRHRRAAGRGACVEWSDGRARVHDRTGEEVFEGVLEVPDDDL